jgi:hypothetical protein
LYFLAYGEAPAQRSSSEETLQLDRLHRTTSPLEFRVAGEWRGGLPNLVSGVLEPDLSKRQIAERPHWKEVTLSSEIALDSVRVLDIGPKSQLVLERKSHWILPRDVETLERALRNTEDIGVRRGVLNPQDERLLRMWTVVRNARQAVE